MLQSTICLSFHTEQLHDEVVWKKVLGFAERCARRSRPLSFYVYPYRAICAGIDIHARIAHLAELGHEIGQHTHFYFGENIEPFNKKTDLSRDNIMLCLSRDKKYIEECGVRPLGFTSGAWLINQEILGALIELGFLYDLSARLHRHSDCTQQDLSCLTSPQTFSNAQGSILRFPTTHSIRAWYGSLVTGQLLKGSCPQVVYLHDYDLLRMGPNLGTRILESLVLPFKKTRSGQEISKLLSTDAMHASQPSQVRQAF